MAAAGESDGWPNRTPSFRIGVGPMDKLPGDVWHATGHLDWVLLATLALGFGGACRVQKSEMAGPGPVCAE